MTHGAFYLKPRHSDTRHFLRKSGKRKASVKHALSIRPAPILAANRMAREPQGDTPSISSILSLATSLCSAANGNDP